MPSAVDVSVPLDGFQMQLRRSELEAVAAGLGTFDSSEEGDLVTLAEALRRLPAADRAPTWELAVRRYGHHKPLAQADRAFPRRAGRGAAARASAPLSLLRRRVQKLERDRIGARSTHAAPH